MNYFSHITVNLKVSHCCFICSALSGILILRPNILFSLIKNTPNTCVIVWPPSYLHSRMVGRWLNQLNLLHLSQSKNFSRNYTVDAALSWVILARMQLQLLQGKLDSDCLSSSVTGGGSEKAANGWYAVVEQCLVTLQLTECESQHQRPKSMQPPGLPKPSSRFCHYKEKYYWGMTGEKQSEHYF